MLREQYIYGSEWNVSVRAFQNRKTVDCLSFVGICLHIFDDPGEHVRCNFVETDRTARKTGPF